MDSVTIRSLCSCGGNVTSFYYMGQVALVQYNSRDSAYLAQQKLHNFQMGQSVITAEFMGEAEAQRIATQMQPPQQSAIQAINQSPWSQAPPSGHFTGGRDPWGSSMPSSQPKYSSGGMDPWNLWDVSDHNSNPLLNNIMGGESM